MLQDEQYGESTDSESEDEFLSNHLQGFSGVVVNNMRRNDPRTARNPDPAAVQSRRERNPPFEKSCHACGRFGHPAVRCDFLAKYAHILEYWKTKDPAEVKAAQERWLERNKKWLDGDHRTPRKIAMTYCHDIGYDVNKLTDEIDWDFFDGVECDSEDE